MARVLVVDDNSDVLDARREVLEAAGHSVIAAATVDEAIAAPPVENVVMDLRVPTAADGRRLLRALRERDPYANIIVLSGWLADLNGQPEESMATHKLQKPAPSAQLLSLLRCLILAILLPCLWLRAETPADVLAHAPILERRANAVGTNSDVALLMYAERLRDSAGAPYLQYTVIFSNEDGGTSTRALMARWGRTTDIEHVYRVWLGRDGKRVRAEIQSKDHKDVPFTGPFEGDRPRLAVITDNNMVGPGGTGREEARLMPEMADLTGASREIVMDQHPHLYRLAAEELVREGKSGLIGDARDYLYLEAEIANDTTRVAARARLRGDSRWFTSNAGRFDWAIERRGFVRTTIGLPPGTRPEQVEEIGFDCLADKTTRDGAQCRAIRVTRAFFLDSAYRPGSNILSMKMDAAIPAGQTRTWKSASK